MTDLRALMQRVGRVEAKIDTAPQSSDLGWVWHLNENELLELAWLRELYIDGEASQTQERRLAQLVRTAMRREAGKLRPSRADQARDDEMARRYWMRRHIREGVGT